MAERKSGWLTKEGGSYRSWKKRWFVLRDGYLEYGKEVAKPALGRIALDTAAAIQESSARKTKKFCFEIGTPERTYYICANDQGEMKEWLNALAAAKKAAAASPASAAAAPPPIVKPPKSKVGLEDFDLLNVIGKGSFGRVLQVMMKSSGKIYAMKVLNKKTIIERNELEHTKAEKSILQKVDHPFLVKLHYSFQTPDKLYFVMDYINGGELFFHLQKDKKFTPERVKFYAAEIVLGLEHLHDLGILYRDLKPENLLLTAEGHMCMTDFGISKEGLLCDDDRTATFCGTPEYLAPEVLEGNGYGKAVDWWSFGTLVFEMMTGLPPFYSQDVQQMYSRIMSAKLHIPSSVSPEGKDLLEKLLIRDPSKRLSDAKEVKQHPYFASINWDDLYNLKITPPYIPPVKGSADTSLVDSSFLREAPTLTLQETGAIGDAAQQNFEGFTFVSESAIANA